MTDDDKLEPDVTAELQAIAERFHRREILALYRAFRASPAVRDEAQGGRYVYAEVDASTVAAEVRQAAERAVAWATNDMLLDEAPHVVWFAPETDGDRQYAELHGREWRHTTARHRLDGQCRPPHPEIWLSATLGPTEALRIAAHECRHLYLHGRGGPEEAQARQYEAKAERSLSGVHTS